METSKEQIGEPDDCKTRQEPQQQSKVISTKHPRLNGELPTVNEWEKYRSYITRLYRHEKKTLNEIARILEQQHGFRATKKMYRRRLSAWGLDKNAKEKEMLVITTMYIQRRRAGKDSRFKLRGSDITIDSLRRYWRRKKCNIDNMTLGDLAASLTPDKVPELQCWTPMPSPISISGSLGESENILRTLRNYCMGSLDTGTWITVGPRRYCVSTKSDVRPLPLFHKLLGSCQTAWKLFDMGNFAEGGRVLMAGTSSLNEIVLAEHPGTMDFFLKCTHEMRMVRRAEVAYLICRQMADLAQTFYGARHPLCLVGRHLSSHVSYEALATFRKVIADSFSQRVGALSYAAIRLQVLYHVQDQSVADKQGAAAALRHLWHQCVAEFGQYDPMTTHVNIALLGILGSSGYEAEAELRARDIVEHSSVNNIEHDPMLDYGSVLHYLALFEERRGDRTSAELHIREAIDWAIKIAGRQGPDTIKYLAVLEKWLFAWGSTASAFAVQERRLEHIRMIDPL